jgi:tRNA pseudouridine65 synthase
MTIYEDEYILIANKPSNLLVHHSYYARNINESSLVQLYKNKGINVYPIHRLDRKTSGLIMLAKKKEFVADFQSLFENGSILKKYFALLRGFVPENGIINSPVKNDRGNYKEAETHYKNLKHIELAIPVEPYQTSRYSLVEFEPKTGRMHQLRIHANKIAHPIIGDPKYGNRHHNHMLIDKFEIDQLFLHAHSLSFPHPFLSKEIFVTVDLPEFWGKILNFNA